MQYFILLCSLCIFVFCLLYNCIILCSRALRSNEQTNIWKIWLLYQQLDSFMLVNQCHIYCSYIYRVLLPNGISCSLPDSQLVKTKMTSFDIHSHHIFSPTGLCRSKIRKEQISSTHTYAMYPKHKYKIYELVEPSRGYFYCLLVRGICKSSLWNVQHFFVLHL